MVTRATGAVTHANTHVCLAVIRANLKHAHHLRILGFELSAVLTATTPTPSPLPQQRMPAHALCDMSLADCRAPPVERALPDMPAEVLRRCVRAFAKLPEVHHVASTCRRLHGVVRDQQTWAGLWVDCIDVRASDAHLARTLLTWSRTLQLVGAAVALPQHLMPLAAITPTIPVCLNWGYEQELAAVLYNPDDAVAYSCHIWLLSNSLPPNIMPLLVTELAWNGRPFTIAIGLTSARSIHDLHGCSQWLLDDEDADEPEDFALEFRLTFLPHQPRKPGWVLNGLPLPIEEHGPWLPVETPAEDDALVIGIVWSSTILRIFTDAHEIAIFDLRRLFPRGEHTRHSLRTFMHATYMPDDDEFDLLVQPRPVMLDARALDEASLCSICAPRRSHAVTVCALCAWPHCRGHSSSHGGNRTRVRGCTECIPPRLADDAESER